MCLAVSNLDTTNLGYTLENINYMLRHFDRKIKERRYFTPVFISYFRSYTQISASRQNFEKVVVTKL